MTTQSTTASSESDSIERAKIQADSQHGVLTSWWQLGIGMSESTCSFAFGIAQDTRIEVRRRTDATLTFAEEMGVGGFRYLRKLVDRLDRVVTRTLRKTGHGVADLASSTLNETIGSSPTRKTDGARAPAAA